MNLKDSKLLEMIRRDWPYFICIIVMLGALWYTVDNVQDLLLERDDYWRDRMSKCNCPTSGPDYDDYDINISMPGSNEEMRSIYPEIYIMKDMSEWL